MAVTTFTNVSLPVGSRTFGPVDVTDDLTYVIIRFSNWTQVGRTLACFVEQSTDGLNWIGLGSMNATPGARNIGRDGTRDCSFGFGLPEGTGRQLRATTIVAGGTVTTTITITTSIAPTLAA